MSWQSFFAPPANPTTPPPATVPPTSGGTGIAFPNLGIFSNQTNFGLNVPGSPIDPGITPLRIPIGAGDKGIDGILGANKPGGHDPKSILLAMQHELNRVGRSSLRIDSAMVLMRTYLLKHLGPLAIPAPAQNLIAPLPGFTDPNK